MKRRSLLKSVAVLPAAAVLPGIAPAQTPPPRGKETQASAAAVDSLKVELAPPGSVGHPVPRFFTPEQLSALRKLGDLFVPEFNGRPGATAAGAAEFLDFYISKDSAERQKLYRSGLDRLNAEARRSHGKPFSGLTGDEAAPILKPISVAWTYHGPQDSFARFLATAKEDLLEATTSSRPYATAAAATSRSAAGVGYYWFPIE